MLDAFPRHLLQDFHVVHIGPALALRLGVGGGGAGGVGAGVSVAVAHHAGSHHGGAEAGAGVGGRCGRGGGLLWGRRGLREGQQLRGHHVRLGRRGGVVLLQTVHNLAVAVAVAEAVALAVVVVMDIIINKLVKHRIYNILVY
jgi:hypothetical protein